MTKDTPKRPSVGRTFGISDSLMSARPIGFKKPKAQEEKVEEEIKPKVQELKEVYKRPELQARDRKIARKSSTLRSKDSVSSSGTTRFKQRHAGKTVSARPGTQGPARGTGVGKGPKSSKRPVGGMSGVHYDLTNKPEDHFRRKYGKSKSAMRTGLRKEGIDMSDSFNDYKYNHKAWAESLSRVGKPKEEVIKEESITVINQGSTYKVKSVSADLGSKVRVGETLTDTHIDDLKEMGINISYVKEDVDSRKIKPQYNTDTHKLVAKKGGSVKVVPKDYQLKDDEYAAESYAAESVDLDAANVEIMLRHDCANHVRHSVHGEGVCVPGEHTLEEISEGEGMVTHYDVMFESGIIEDVPVYDLEIISEEGHLHASKKGKKKAMELQNGDEDENGDDSEDENGKGKAKKKSKKLDKVDPDELEGTHDDRDDGDIDNDGDEDDSDKFLHKKRKAITKNIKKEEVKFRRKSLFKEWVSMGKAKLDESKPKDAMHAHTIAKHYYQIAIRDDMFGKKAQFTENMGLAKKFFGIYKKLETEGDTTAKNLYKDGSEEAIENFNKSEISQTNEALTKFSPSMDKSLADKDRAQMKAQGTIKMRKSDGDGIHGTTVQQNDTAKIAALKAKGYVKVSEDATADRKQEMIRKGAVAAKKEKDRIKMMGKSHFQGVNDRRNAPKVGSVQNEDFQEVQFEGEIIYEKNAIQKADARTDSELRRVARMRKVNDAKTFHGLGGEQKLKTPKKADSKVKYKESFDSTNMPEHSPEILEMTPDNYAYNRSSWQNALGEVYRFQNKSGHRVTQPDKSGDEHIVMQLRKSISVGANHSGVKFKDGETHKISAKTAQKHLDHYSTLKPEDKIKWQNSAAHSRGGLSSASGDKKKGQDKPESKFKRDEPTRQLINPMDKD